MPMRKKNSIKDIIKNISFVEEDKNISSEEDDDDEDDGIIPDEVLAQIQKIEAITLPAGVGTAIDSYEEINYERIMNPRCKVCNNPFVKEAETQYIQTRSLSSVRKFFISKGFNISYMVIDQHMKDHCRFGEVTIDYKQKIIARRDEISDIQSEGIDYSMTMIIDQIMDLKSIDTSGNLDQTERVAKTLFQGTNALTTLLKLKIEALGLKDEMEKTISGIADVFVRLMSEMLDEVTDDMRSSDFRLLIADKMKELKNYFDTINKDYSSKTSKKR
jgi:hypothetical protein